MNKTVSNNTIWRPFTQMATAEPPLFVKKALGATLYLENGKEILDCISSWWVNLHGHAHPEIAQAIYEQAQTLEQVIFAGFTHEPAEKLAQKLLEYTPKNLNHVFFSDNGSTSVEVALKLAFQYWQNKGENPQKFLAFRGGYHGDTFGSMSIGCGSPFWQRYESLLFSVDLINYPSTFDNDPDIEEKENNSLKELEEILTASNSKYAALCIEPLVQGAAGMLMTRPLFLRKISEICKQHSILLIFDEVMTGFGRTGDWFACTKAQVEPDLLCLSKGITGGFLPLSTTLASTEIYNAFLSSDHSKTFFHGHSYTANPLACSAALASLKLLEQSPQLFKEMEIKHRKLAKEYLEKFQLNKSIEKMRFCGTIFAFDLSSKENNDYFSSLGPSLKKQFIEEGLLIRPLGNTIYLMPPYCISEQELLRTYQSINKIISQI